MKVIITKDGLGCSRCGHTWIPRGEKKPSVCPKCHSPYWNKPRKSKRRKP